MSKGATSVTSSHFSFHVAAYNCFLLLLLISSPLSCSFRLMIRPMPPVSRHAFEATPLQSLQAPHSRCRRSAATSPSWHDCTPSPLPLRYPLRLLPASPPPPLLMTIQARERVATKLSTRAGGESAGTTPVAAVGVLEGIICTGTVREARWRIFQLHRPQNQITASG